MNPHLCDFDKRVEGAQGGRGAAHEYVERARKSRWEVSEAAEPIAARCPEHFLMIFERRAENSYLCDRPPVVQ